MVHCTNSGERMKRNGISKLLDLTNFWTLRVNGATIGKILKQCYRLYNLDIGPAGDMYFNIGNAHAQGFMYWLVSQ